MALEAPEGSASPGGHWCFEAAFIPYTHTRTHARMHVRALAVCVLSHRAAQGRLPQTQGGMAEHLTFRANQWEVCVCDTMAQPSERITVVTEDASVSSFQPQNLQRCCALVS